MIRGYAFTGVYYLLSVICVLLALPLLIVPGSSADIRFRSGSRFGGSREFVPRSAGVKTCLRVLSFWRPNIKAGGTVSFSIRKSTILFSSLAIIWRNIRLSAASFASSAQSSSTPVAAATGRRNRSPKGWKQRERPVRGS